MRYICWYGVGGSLEIVGGLNMTWVQRLKRMWKVRYAAAAAAPMARLVLTAPQPALVVLLHATEPVVQVHVDVEGTAKGHEPASKLPRLPRGAEDGAGAGLPLLW